MKRGTFITEVFGANWQLYLMTLPGMIFLALFAYLPMFGIIAAFQDFNIIDGFFGSRFVGLKNFIHFFIGIGGEQALNAVKNTLLLNTFFILTSLVFQISVALAINEIKSNISKKSPNPCFFCHTSYPGLS